MSTFRLNQARFLIIIFIIFLSSCSVHTSREDKDDSTGKPPILIEDALHFFVIGDWGRNGEYRQKELATAMNEVARLIEPEFIISTGDNFYPDGVASVDDPYWISSFENVYSGALLFCPWNVVLGNHDYRGNPQAEIDYTNISQRWHMPARYYYQDIEEDVMRARFVYLDTSPFEDEYYQEQKYSQVWEEDSTAQLNWMNNILSFDSTDWKIVIGHHPLYSGGKRIDQTGTIRNHLEKVLIEHDVDLYLAGHEHDLQYIKPEGPTHHIISGAGSEIRTTGMMEHSVFAKSIQGFVAISLTREVLFIQIIDWKGQLIFSHEIMNDVNNN